MQIATFKNKPSAGRADRVFEQTESLGEKPTSGGQSPFHYPLFRMLWIATLVSNCGTWMQEVANSWLMTTLAPDPLMVSLVQVAAALPMFMLGLPAGALADLVDKRRWLLGTQIWMMMAAAAMAILTFCGIMSPWLLLICSFFLAIGAALNSPGWHSVTPEIVPKGVLQSAVVLNGVVINCARALGPALGGLVVVKLGPGAAFALNALSFLAVVHVLRRWRREARPAGVPSERLMSAIRVGLQHVLHSPLMRLLIVRAGILVFTSSVVWSMLPLLARQEYGLGARGYSLLLVANALGAIIGGTVILPRLRRTWSANRIVSGAWLGFIPTLLVLSKATHPVAPFLALLWGGACYILMLSSFHLAAQSITPEWVRARSMAVYLLTFSGALTLGSLFWGYLARGLGLRQTLAVGAAFLLMGCVTSWLAPLRTGETFDHETTPYWPDPKLGMQVPLAHGPIMVTVEYEVRPQDAKRFRHVMERIRRIRYRNGVMRWSLYVDLENPNLYHEVYLEESWAAHLRQHERTSCYEKEVTQLAYGFNRNQTPPKVRHLGYCDHTFPRHDKPALDTPPQIPLWFLD